MLTKIKLPTTNNHIYVTRTIVDGYPADFCLADRYFKQLFYAKQLYEIGPIRVSLSVSQHLCKKYQLIIYTVFKRTRCLGSD